MLYEMISGNRPFKGKNKSELMQSVISSNVTFPEFFSEEAKDLINNLLQKNQSKRLSVEKLKEHKFYKGIDWTKVLESKSIHMPFVPIQENASNEDTKTEAELDSVYTSKKSDKNSYNGFTYACSNINHQMSPQETPEISQIDNFELDGTKIPQQNDDLNNLVEETSHDKQKNNDSKINKSQEPA